MDGKKLILLPAVLSAAAIIIWLLLHIAVWSPFCDGLNIDLLTVSKASPAYQNVIAVPVTADRPYDGQTIGTLLTSFSEDMSITEGQISDSENLSHDTSSPLPGEGGRAVIDAQGTSLAERLSKAGSDKEITLELYYGTYTYSIEKVFTFREDSTDALIGTDRQELLIYAELPDSNEDAQMYRGILCTLTEGPVVQWNGKAVQ